MPMTMELKSSLPIIISQTSRAAYDPLTIAMPVLAIFIAGESLTPSPVTVTTNPNFCSDWTMYNFWEGFVRANITFGLYIILRNSRPCSLSGKFYSSAINYINCGPFITMFLVLQKAYLNDIFCYLISSDVVFYSVNKLHCLAIEVAVNSISPVITITLIPALFIFSIV